MTGQVSAAPSSRSKACRECRIAKLKCGNERPSCYRCVNKGYKCEYPDPLEINFRNENYKAAVRAESLWRQRSSVYATDSSQTYPARSKIFQSVQSRSSSSNGCPITQSSRSYIQVKNDIRHTAITKFFQDFGCTSQIKTPWLDFFQMLPEFYEKPSSTDSPIAHIILAVAIAYLPHDGSYPESEILARTEYCEGIHKISAHLRRRTQVPMNEIIVSTILMGLFESLMPQLSVEDFCQGLRWLTHLHGAFAMVRMIEMHGAADLDLRIPNVIYFQTVITCIRNRIRPPLSIQTWYCMGNSAVPRSPGPPILHLMYRVACWQADMDAAMSKGNVDPRQAEADIVEMLVTLRAADIRILQFKSTLPPNMVFHIRNWNDQGDEYPLSRNHPLLNLLGAPRNVYTFRSCWSTTPRVLALVLRVVIHRNIVKCCTWMAQRQTQAEDWLLQSTVSRNIIIDMIEHISCCVNSLLMDPFIPPWELDQKPPQEYQYERGIGTSMRLMGLPWPMLVATMALDDAHVLRGVGRHRAQWLRDVQDYVHDQVGIRHSLLQESSPQAHLNTQARALDMDILGGPDALSLADPVPPLPGYVLSGNV